jgi:hypothetical protein
MRNSTTPSHKPSIAGDSAQQAAHPYLQYGNYVPYSGEAPFGSCHLQCVANMLAWQGVSSAEACLCPTWGFSWPGGMVLEGSGRWTNAIRSVYGIELEERYFDSFSEARAAEEESVKQGYPVASIVDAWHVPSPFKGIEHIAHCVIVVASAAGHIWIVDPMNCPKPVRYTLADWENMRSAACTSGHRTFLVTSDPRRRADSADLVRWLRSDIQVNHAGDCRQLDAFLAFCHDNHPGPPDVSEVAAERLYLARLLKRAARSIPGLAGLADELLSLARRWYLSHSLARESADNPRQLARQIRLLNGLASRDRIAAEQARALLEGASGLEEDG